MNRIYLSLKVLVGFLMLATSIACSPTSSTPANISFNFNSSSSANRSAGGNNNYSSVTPQRLMIYVTAPDITQGISFVWQGCQDCNPAPTIPNVNLTVPTGAGRLIQVLMVFSDGSLEYGDITSVLNSGNNAVDVYLNPIAINANSIQGEVIGRYLSSPGVGPTGVVSIQFQPVPGKPFMQITSGPMINGWFELFGFRDIPLDYVLDSGTDVFGGPTSLAGIYNASNPSLVMRIDKPAYTSIYANGTNSNSWTQNPSLLVTGYFGPSASNGAMIYSIPANYSNMIPGLFNSAIPNQLLPVAIGTYSSNFVTFNNGTPDGAVHSAFQSSFDFISGLVLRVPGLSGRNNSKNPFGFYSIFFNPPNNSQIDQPMSPVSLQVAPDGVSRTLSFNLLPGINNSLIDGVQIFKRNGLPANAPGLQEEDSDIPCALIQNGTVPNFTFISNTPMPSSGSLPIVLGLPMVFSDVGNTEFAVCPHRSQGYIGGIAISKNSIGYTNASSGSLNLALSSGMIPNFAGNPNSVGFNFDALGACIPMNLYVNGPSGLITSGTLSANLGGTGVTYYSDYACSTSISSISSASSGTYFFVKPSSPSASLSITTAMPNTMGAFGSMTATGTMSANSVPYTRWMPEFYLQTCNPIEVWDYDPLTYAVRPVSANYQASVYPTNVGEIRNSCSLSVTYANTSLTASFTGVGTSNGYFNYTNSSVRLFDNTKDADLTFSSSGIVVSNSVLISPVASAINKMPDLWLRFDPHFQINPLTWTSRTNGFMAGSPNSTRSPVPTPLPIGSGTVQTVAMGTIAQLTVASLNATSMTSLAYQPDVAGAILFIPNTSIGTYNELMGLWNGTDIPATSFKGFGFGIDGNGRLRADFGNGSSTPQAALASAALTQGMPHYILFKRVINTGGYFYYSVDGGPWQYLSFASYSFNDFVELTLGQRSSPYPAAGVYILDTIVWGDPNNNLPTGPVSANQTFSGIVSYWQNVAFPQIGSMIVPPQ